MLPGLTGLWQIYGRGKTEFDERLRLDILYIQRRCLMLDLAILLRTVGAIAMQRGAHWSEAMHLIMFWAILVLIGYTYLIFPILTMLRRRLRQQSYISADITPSTSMLIAAHNGSPASAPSSTTPWRSITRPSDWKSLSPPTAQKTIPT